MTIITIIYLQLTQLSNIMSGEEQFQAVQFLIEYFNIQLDSPEIDIRDPYIIVTSLAELFPGKAEKWIQSINQLERKQMWKAILKFISQNMLENQEMEITDLGQEEILSIYEIVAQYVGELMEHQYLQNKQLSSQHKLKESDNKAGKTNGEKQMKKQKAEPEKKIKKQKNIAKPIVQEKNRANKSAQKKVNQQRTKANINEKQKQMTKINKISSSQPLKVEVVQTIKVAIQKSKEKFSKSNNLFKDEKSLEAVKKAKREFNYFLSQFQREQRKKVKASTANARKKVQKNGIDDHYFKCLQKKQKTIEQNMISEQLKYFMALRDRKIGFINKVHKLTQQLERQRQIDWAHQQKKRMQEQRLKTRLKIQNADAVFGKNMQLLRQQYKSMKKQNDLQNYDQNIICREMESAVVKQKMGELQLIKTLWQQENFKLNNVIGDEEKIKNKLIDLYRRNRP